MNELRTYTFSVRINGPNGHQMLKVQLTEDQLQCCPCGHDLFLKQFRVVHIKPALFHPAFLGVPEMCCGQEIYLCARCGYELSALSPTKAALRSEAATC